MTRYWLVRLGKGNIYAKEMLDSGYIGIGWFADTDLTHQLPETWQAFNREMIPQFLLRYPDKSKITAGLACGNTWSVCKGIAIGDVVLCPLGNNEFAIVEVTGDYQYNEEATLAHQRPVRILRSVSKDEFSEALASSTRSYMTAFSLTGHAIEISQLIGTANDLIATDPTVENPTTFALEKHLEEFLVSNWAQTELGRGYDVYKDVTDDGEVSGQQFQTDVGPIDILAISKDKKTLLVVELKRGRASDTVVGQIQRYMGYVKGELAEPDQTVRGVIIALDDDKKIRYALSVAQNIDFMTYKVSFALEKR